MAQKSILRALGLLALATSPVAAFWRLPCKAPVLVERADPIINPGVASPHLHTIMGGNGFGFSMDFAQAQAATCSTCTVEKDLSSYWIPTLWYAAENGSFISVPQVGGVLVYYLQRPGDGEKLTAFPEGLRVVAGDPMKRSYGNDKESAAINYACLNYGGPATPETNGFPNNRCSSGLRAQIFFPSCWDGKNLDSPDHKSHMSYPANDHAYGKCPPSHPVHFVSLFYEVIFSTDKFSDMWYGNKQPFVWSMGDPTGYGLHGDFFSGWDVAHLQKAIDECTNNSGRVEDCPVFTLTPDNVATGCKIPPSIDEKTSGLLDALPGCNPVQPGPERAVVSNSADCTVSDVIGTPQAFFTDLTQTKNWFYTGCGRDSIYDRKFTGASTSSSSMTVETCVDFCSGKGFSVAGTEYGNECYCANSIPSAAAPVPGYIGDCMMPCAGDAGEFCGGAGTISLYQKCTGNCQNAQFGVVGNSTAPPIAPPGPVRATVPTPSPLIVANVLASNSSTSRTANGIASSSYTSRTANAIASSSYTSRTANAIASSLSTSRTANAIASSSSTSTTRTSTPAVSSPTITSVDTNGYYGSAPSPPAACVAPTSSITGDQATTAPSDGVIIIPTDATSAGVSPTISGSVVTEATSFPIPSSVPKTNITLPNGWKAAGCYVDPVFPRLFQFWASFSGYKVSSSKCVDYCDKQGFPFAGTENGGQCFCSEDLAEDAELVDDSECSSVCKGDKSQICGGPARLSVFTKLGNSYPGRMKRHLHKHRRTHHDLSS